MKQGKTYKIWWIDTCGFNGWYFTDDVKQKMKDLAYYQESVGFFICQDKNFVSICTTINKADDMAEWGHIELIPIGCIRKVKLNK